MECVFICTSMDVAIQLELNRHKIIVANASVVLASDF